MAGMGDVLWTMDDPAPSTVPEPLPSPSVNTGDFDRGYESDRASRRDSFDLPVNFGRQSLQLDMRGAMGAEVSPEDSRLVEGFMVVGLGSNPAVLEVGKLRRRQSQQFASDPVSSLLSVTFRPQYITSYPELSAVDAPHLDEIPMFSNPLGCRLATQSVLPTSHSFLVVGQDRKRYHGVCLTFYEKMTPNELAEAMDASGVEDRDGRIDEKTTLYMPISLMVLSSWPFFGTFKTWLGHIYRITLSRSEVPWERYIVNLVSETPVPPPGSVDVVLHMNGNQLKFSRPHVNMPPLADFDLRPLFETLDLDNVLRLFKCVLAERRIIIHSSRVGLLTSVIYAMTYLIFPFYWSELLVPVLPCNMYSLLHSPVSSYLIGVHSTAFQQVSMPGKTTVVDLDLNRIHIPENVPDLPKKQASKLISKLKASADVYHAGSAAAIRYGDLAFHNAPIPDEETGRGSQFNPSDIKGAFLRFFVSLLFNYRAAIIKPATSNTDADLAFSGSKFLKQQPEGARQFLLMFLQTGLFVRFMKDRLSPMARDYELMYFDECIDAKANRYTVNKVTRNRRKTLFLQDERFKKTEAFHVPPPNSDGVHGKAYMYERFPGLSVELLSQPRETSPLIRESVMNPRRKTNVPLQVVHIRTSQSGSQGQAQRPQSVPSHSSSQPLSQRAPSPGPIQPMGSPNIVQDNQRSPSSGLGDMARIADLENSANMMRHENRALTERLADAERTISELRERERYSLQKFDGLEKQLEELGTISQRLADEKSKLEAQSKKMQGETNEWLDSRVEEVLAQERAAFAETAAEEMQELVNKHEEEKRSILQGFDEQMEMLYEERGALRAELIQVKSGLMPPDGGGSQEVEKVRKEAEEAAAQMRMDLIKLRDEKMEVEGRLQEVEEALSNERAFNAPGGTDDDRVGAPVDKDELERVREEAEKAITEARMDMIRIRNEKMEVEAQLAEVIMQRDEMENSPEHHARKLSTLSEVPDDERNRLLFDLEEAVRGKKNAELRVNALEDELALLASSEKSSGNSKADSQLQEELREAKQRIAEVERENEALKERASADKSVYLNVLKDVQEELNVSKNLNETMALDNQESKMALSMRIEELCDGLLSSQSNLEEYLDAMDGDLSSSSDEEVEGPLQRNGRKASNQSHGKPLPPVSADSRQANEPPAPTASSTGTTPQQRMGWMKSHPLLNQSGTPGTVDNGPDGTVPVDDGGESTEPAGMAGNTVSWSVSVDPSEDLGVGQERTVIDLNGNILEDIKDNDSLRPAPFVESLSSQSSNGSPEPEPTRYQTPNPCIDQNGGHHMTEGANGDAQTDVAGLHGTVNGTVEHSSEQSHDDLYNRDSRPGSIYDAVFSSSSESDDE